MRAGIVGVVACCWLFGCGGGADDGSGSGGQGNQGGAADSGGSSSSGGSSASGSATGTGGGESAPHGGETVLPSVLTGYRSLAANQTHLFVGTEGVVKRVDVEDFSVETVYEDGMGSIAVDDEHLFVSTNGIWRMTVEGDAPERLNSGGPIANIYLDGGFVYFHDAGQVRRLAVDAAVDAEPEVVTAGSGPFAVHDGVVLLRREDEIVRHDIASGDEVAQPLPASNVQLLGLDEQAAFLLTLSTDSGALFEVPEAVVGALPLLEEHELTFGNFSSLIVSDGRAVYALPGARRDYSSVYVRGLTGDLATFGNDAIPQPTGLAVVGDYVYVSSFGTSGLAGNPYRLGTVMRFPLAQ